MKRHVYNNTARFEIKQTIFSILHVKMKLLDIKIDITSKNYAFAFQLFCL